MKFKVTLKDPDGFYNCIDDAVCDEVAKLGITDDREINAITDARKDKVNKALRNWVEYGEYITIEFDTEEQTATVVPL